MPHLALNGGEKICNLEWPAWPIWDDRESNGLLSVLKSGEWWYGKNVKDFEGKFAEFQNAKYGITTSSGTAGLEVALLALGVGAGDEVIVPPYTFMATASAVLRVNAVPVFADIQAHSLCIDPNDVERKITDKTKAIIPVHLAGYVADMDRLNKIGKEHGLFLIEDACHSWGSQWKGKGTGALGSCGVFSFQASKNLNCAEGGIILTNNEELADLCRSYTNCGRGKDKPWYEHYVLGGNLRLTEFQAALLLAQFTRLEEQTLRRQTNAEILNAGLRDVPGVVVIENDTRMTRRAYHFYPFRIDSKALGVSRERFIEAVEAEGVPAGVGYDRPLYKNPLFERKGDGPEHCPISCPFYGRKIDYTKTSCPVCEQVIAETVWIFHNVLLADETAMHSIVSAIRKVCENAGELL